MMPKSTAPTESRLASSPAQHQDDDAEEQRERDVNADDDRAAQIAEKDPLDHEDQQTAEDEVVQHGLGGDGHQDGAVVERHQLDAGRQRSVGIDLCDFGLDARHDVVGVQRAVHDHDRRDDVVFEVAPGLAEPRHVADIDLRDVLDRHRHAVGLRQDDVLDVADLVALRQVVGAAAVDEADAADIDRLLAETDGAAADIEVGIADRADDLGQRDAVGIELVQVDLDLEFLGGAAPGIDLHHAGNGQQPALDDPVLDGAQIGQPEMRRADHLIAVDLAHQARALDRGGHAVRQVDVLLQADRRLRQREVVIDAVIERDAHERQAVERRRADVVDPRGRREPDLHRNRVVALHLLGRETGGLRGDLQDNRRRVGIGLDVELGEGDQSAGDEHQQAQQDDRTPRQPE